MATVLQGLGVSPGTVAGVVARLGLPPRPPADEAPGSDPAAELARVLSALADVADLLDARASAASGAAADVLHATALMARDPGLAAAVKALLEAGRPTAHALDAAVEGFCDALAAAGGYLAERVADLRDVRDRALALLLGEPMPGVPHPGHPFVLVGRDLSPADTATLDPAEVLALVTELGGPTSHTAILAKGLGVPAVVRCAGALELADGTAVVIDGSRRPRGRRSGRDRARPGGGPAPPPADCSPPPRTGRGTPPTGTRSRCWPTSAAWTRRCVPPRRTTRASACSAPRRCSSTAATRPPSRSRPRCTRPCSRRSGVAGSSCARWMPGPTSRSPSSTTGTRTTPRSGCAAIGWSAATPSCSRGSSPRWPGRRRRPVPTCG